MLGKVHTYGIEHSDESDKFYCKVPAVTKLRSEEN